MGLDSIEEGLHRGLRVEVVAILPPDEFLMSLADLLMTYTLLRTSPHFYEANPIARYFFRRWNILGMTLLKFSLAGFILVLCEIIERYRPGWGRMILILASGAAACVVARGIRLLVGV